MYFFVLFSKIEVYSSFYLSSVFGYSLKKKKKNFAKIVILMVILVCGFFFFNISNSHSNAKYLLFTSTGK